MDIYLIVDSSFLKLHVLLRMSTDKRMKYVILPVHKQFKPGNSTNAGKMFNIVTFGHFSALSY